MIIEKLIAKNFKKHKTINLNFLAGRNLITGSNYSGKSTILQAILVGLYGNSMAPGTTQDLVHDGAKDFEVEIHLDTGVCIRRTSRNSSVIGEDGEVKVRTHSAVNKWCEEMLGTDRKTFLKVFASEQGSPQALLSMEGAELQKFVETAIGLEKLDSLKKVVSAKVTRSKANHEAHACVSLTKDAEEEHLDIVDKCSLKFSKNSTAVLDADEVLAELSVRRDETKKEINRQTKLKATEEAYDLSKDVVTSLLAKLPKPVALVDTSKLRKVLKADTEAHLTYREGKTAFTKAVKNVKETSEYLQEKIEGLQVVRPVAACADEARAIHRSCTESVAEAEKCAKELKAQLSDSSCPTCERPYEEGRNIKRLEVKLEGAQAALKSINAAKSVAASDLFIKEAEEKAYDKAEAKAQKLRGAVEELKSQLAKAVSKRDGCAVEANPKFEGEGWRNHITEQQDILDKLKKDNILSEETEVRRTELVTELEKPSA